MNPPSAGPDPAPRDFKYYIFDWDNNILHMPTRIHLQRRRADGGWEDCSVSTSFYAAVRHDEANYRPPDGDWEKAFRDFRDFAHLPESAFLADTRAALAPVTRGEVEAAPSFQRFRRALVEGRLIAIVTARGHRATTLRKGVEYFIEQVLSPEEKAEMIRNLRAFKDAFGEPHAELSDAEVLDGYLSLNHYHAVTSPEFLARMKRDFPGAQRPEEAKQFAIRDFVEHVVRILRKRGGFDRPISVGFSDDDPGNVAAVERYIAGELGRAFPGVKFVIYDTSDPDQERGRKIVVQGQMELGLDVPKP
jgi:hypothetical protein